MTRITENLIFIVALPSESSKKKKDIKHLFNEKRNILYDTQHIIKSTNISKIIIREIIQIVGFHHMFESIQFSGFPQNFRNFVPNNRSNIRQVILSGTGFSKSMV